MTKLSLKRTVPAQNKQTVIKYTTCGENLKKGSVICIIENRAYHLPMSFIGSKPIGVTLDAFREGDRLPYVERGAVSNSSYAFAPPFGSPVWVGCGGVPVDVEPVNCDKFRIGYTISETSFFLAPDSYANHK